MQISDAFKNSRVPNDFAKSIFPRHAHTCAVDVICLCFVQIQHCCAPLIATTTTTLAWDGDCFLVGQGVGQMKNGKFFLTAAMFSHWFFLPFLQEKFL